MANEADALVKQGAEMVKSELVAQIENAMGLLQTMDIKESGLISDSLLANAAVHRDVKARVRDRQQNVAKLIAATAYYIESARSEPVQMPAGLSFRNEKRFTQLRNAESELRLSFGTLAAVVDIYKEVNESIRLELKKVAQEPDPLRKTSAFLKNAILVHELSNFVIERLESFDLAGLREIQAIRDEIFQEIEEGEKSDLTLDRDADRTPQAQQESTRQLIADRRALRRLVVKKWQEIMQKVEGGGQKEGVVKILDSLRVTRLNARNQIDALNLAATTALVDKAVTSLAELANSLPVWELPRIDEQTMRELLNLGRSNA